MPNKRRPCSSKIHDGIETPDISIFIKGHKSVCSTMIYLKPKSGGNDHPEDMGTSFKSNEIRHLMSLLLYKKKDCTTENSET